MLLTADLIASDSLETDHEDALSRTLRSIHAGDS